VTAAAFASQLEARVGPDALQRLSEEISAVERVLEERIASEVELVRESGLHSLRAGGKRLRPALVTLCAEATGLLFSQERTRKLGACMEMIHMATLMHDDVIDRAGTRRGRETAAARFGNSACILSGDVLLAKAMAILAEDGELAIIRNVSKAVVDLAEGEVRELEVRGQTDLSQAGHLDILRRKTANFIASCCEVGGLAAQASADAVEALGGFGRNVGMAFQIADDLLDFSGDSAQTGKPGWTDFSEGCPTLPYLLARERLAPEDRDLLDQALGADLTSDLRQRCSRLIESSGALAEAERLACQFVEQGLAELDRLPDTPARKLLGAVAEFVVWRKA
jgi:geranylgeranyl pyrophosphate synthase